LYILFPIEIYSREIAFKIQLGYLFAKKNYIVIIAEQRKCRDIAVELGNKCIFIGKHFFLANDHNYDLAIRPLVEANVNIVFFDEEGLTFSSEESEIFEWCNKRLPTNLLPKDSILLHWGKAQRDITRKKNKDFTNYVIGVPAFDAIKNIAKNNVNNISEMDVLLSINVRGLSPPSSHNNIYDTIFERINGLYSDRMNLRDLKSEISDEISLLYAYWQLERNNVRVTLRSHPAQSVKNYYSSNAIDKFSSYLTEDIITSLNRHDVLFHTGCTTAIQAHFLGKKTIGLTSARDNWELSNIYIDDLSCEPEEDLYLNYKKVKSKSKISHFTPHGQEMIDNHDMSTSSYNKILDIILNHFPPVSNSYTTHVALCQRIANKKTFKNLISKKLYTMKSIKYTKEFQITKNDIETNLIAAGYIASDTVKFKLFGCDILVIHPN